MRIVAGVDCHKSSHTVVFLNEIGVTCGQLTFKRLTLVMAMLSKPPRNLVAGNGADAAPFTGPLEIVSLD